MKYWGLPVNVPLKQPIDSFIPTQFVGGSSLPEAKLNRTALPAQRAAGHVAAPGAHDPMAGKSPK